MVNFSLIDTIILIGFLVVILFSGIVISRFAGKNMNTYFLAGNKLPWYVLGVSNASGMMDITSTMWLVYLFVLYGVKSIFFTWLWPVFNQVFLMIFLSVWIRRSNVMTGAEWITTRFGKGRGAELSRLSIIIFALISVIGFLAYAFKGIGKFAGEFLPWELTANTYALIFISITTIYVIFGGMMSVTITDILQFFLFTAGAIGVGIVALNKVDTSQLVTLVPDGWLSFGIPKNMNLDWSGSLPALNQVIEKDGYSYFSIIVGMMLFKGLFVSLAGPAPNYDMQRILAARTPRESALMSGISSVVIPFPRYFMVVGVSLIALVFFTPQLQTMGNNIDLEVMLPFVISNYIPKGLLGLVIVGFLAAFMSTFDSTVNAGSAYLVNDLYRNRHPHKSRKTYMRLSYLASLLIVLSGVLIGLIIKTIDDITQWLFAALYGGYSAANVLKWYWWRLNGYGYFYGMLAGILSALLIPLLFPGASMLFAYPVILAISFAACIAGSYATRVQDMDELLAFYTSVKPWGFWKPVLTAAKANNPDFESNKRFWRDALNILIGMIWQTALIALPVFILLKQKTPLVITAIAIVAASVILKFSWYNKLERN